MIIELGEFNYTDEYEIINQLKTMMTMKSGTVTLSTNNFAEVSYLEALETEIEEYGERSIIEKFLPFTSSVELLVMAFESFLGEMLNIFEVKNIEELRRDAKNRFGENFGNIDERVDVYSAIVNGEQVYFEMM